jgi:trehalose 6-phosphate synthase/phosphatase
MNNTNIIEKFRKAENKLILLDYDGTLVNYAPAFADAKPSGHLLNILKKVNNTPRTKLIIITGRNHLDIDKFLGHLKLIIVAEHGAMLKENEKWKKQINDDNSWKNKISPFLNKAVLSCPGSLIEEKHFSLAWHYRKADTNAGHIHSRELLRALEHVVKSHNLKIIDGNMVVEITSGLTNKGKAIQFIIEQNQYDFILCIGDDKTDEDMFEYLLKHEIAITIKVGKGDTLAKNNLGTVQEVLLLLEQLYIYY